MVRSALLRASRTMSSSDAAILRDAAKTPLLRMRTNFSRAIPALSLGRRHHDLHDMRRFELDADAGPHRWIFGIDPFVPGAVHLVLALHVGDVDDGREDPALVRTAQCEALVDPRERLDGLLVQRGGDRIGRDRHGEYQIVVNHGAAAGWRETGKATDHGLLRFD